MTDPSIDDERKAELQAMLAKMHEISGAFYHAAVRIRCRPFIEFCGLMNEYIKICEGSLKAGIDFEANTHAGIPLKMESYEAAYLAEKFDCVFGPTLRADAQLHEILWHKLHHERSENADHHRGRATSERAPTGCAG